MINFKNSVSFEEIKQQVKQYVAQQDGELDISDLSGISLMIDTISAGIEVSKFEVFRALQECFLNTAVLPDSIYNIIDTLHIQLATKAPCFSQMTISSNNTTTIQPYTQWHSGDVFVYNREKQVSNNEPHNIEIFQGKVQEEDFVVEDNRPNIVLKYGDFQVSIEDIHVYVNGQEWYRFDGDQYLLTDSDATFLVDVDSEGFVKVYFGTGKFGMVPQLGANVVVRYAISDGYEGAQNIQSMKFTNETLPGVNAYGSGSLAGGDNEKSAEFYRTYGPWLGASKEWASRKKDFKAIAGKFPGVIDCSVQTQADIAPTDKRWENVIQLTLLTNDIWVNQSWNNLTNLLTDKSMSTLYFFKKDPQVIKIDIGYTIWCYSNATLESVKAKVEQALKDFLEPKPGCLGKAVLLSDLEDVIRSVDNSQISGYTRNYPNIDYDNLEYYEYITYGDIDITCKYGEK